MQQSQSIDPLIEEFCINTIEATGLLCEKMLYGQMLVLMYSAIDSMGLLDADPMQQKATGETFKRWVEVYLLPNGQFDFNAVDFWAARCSVLHTFTSVSDLSNNGKAREIQYYSGPKNSQMEAIITATKEIDNGKHVPAHIEDTYLAFLKGIHSFATNLSANCKINRNYEKRMRQILQMFEFDKSSIKINVEKGK